MIYVCSDIHGLFDRYITLVNKLTENDTLYILGDVIDRGPDGIKIIKDVMTRNNIILISGNHEDFMYTYLSNQLKNSKYKSKSTNLFDNGASFSFWFYENNGGSITYKEFLKESDEDQMKIYNFISNLPMIVLLNINGQKFHLSHTGTILSHDFSQYDINDMPKILRRSDLNKKDIEIILWESVFNSSYMLYEDDFPNDYICIVGHVPVQIIRQYYDVNDYHIYKNENLIDIDSGCALYSIKNSNIKTALSYLCLNTLEDNYII